jgi:hypothetical protein
LVKLRNPWGSKEWEGKWGDNDPNWTPELRERLEVQTGDDGIFFMELLDYLKFFDHTCICMDVPEDYVTKSLIYDGNNTKQETEQIQFGLKLNGPINCDEKPLSLEVIQ